MSATATTSEEAADTITIERRAPSAIDFPRQMDRCPNEACDAVIPLTHVVVDGRRLTARVQCPACRRVYQCPIRYAGGVAVPAGEVKLVENARSINAMKAIVALRTEG
jgi:hypothetical protein